MKAKIFRAGAFAAVLAVTGVVFAEQRSAQQPKQQQQTQQQARRQPQQQGAFAFGVTNNFTGKISAIQTVTANKHSRLIGVLTTSNGGQLSIDLGNPDNIKKFNLKDGDTITCSGPLARFAGREMLLVERVKKGQESTDIQRKFRDIAGQVNDVRFMALEVVAPMPAGEALLETSHVLAQLKTKDGKLTWVDLGPGKNLVSLDIAPGDQLSAQGAFITFQGGNRVLVARNVDKNGKKLAVDWGHEQMVRRLPAAGPAIRG